MDEIEIDHSPPTDEDIQKALLDSYENGIPPTPARWQRKFLWGYRKTSDVIDTVKSLRQA